MNQRKNEESMPHYFAFDTLAYANKLKKAGADPKLAEAQAEATAEIMNDLIINQLATKADLQKLEYNLRTDMQNLKAELQSFIIKTISMAIAILGGLQTLFHFLP